ncbi:MAG TPA: acyl-CoA dehydrogenase family protein [Pseudomonadales bacterium]|nr:acyl-CoA dehydrogenase family protein [Pseudomonadales bacterium]
MTNMADEIATLFRANFERYSREHYRFEDRFGFIESPLGYSTNAWQDYAELGWLSLRLPESYGGVDADAHTLIALMESVGSRLLMEPILSSVILASGLLVRLASPAQLDEWLPKIAAGKMLLACTEVGLNRSNVTLQGSKITGSVDIVLHGDSANKIIVFAQDEEAGGIISPVLLEPNTDSVHRHAYRLVDGRGAASFNFNNTSVERLQSDINQAALTAFSWEANVSLCAEAVGCMQALLTDTTEYLNIRKQFGRPIGSNQALQHRLVDAYLLLEQSRALLQRAVEVLAQPEPEHDYLIHGARSFISVASRKVANEAVQMHGGIGITEELAISHYFRRLMVNRQLFGNPDHHFESFRRLI